MVNYEHDEYARAKPFTFHDITTRTSLHLLLARRCLEQRDHVLDRRVPAVHASVCQDLFCIVMSIFPS